MSGVMRRLVDGRGRPGDDRGSIAVLFGVLVASGMLLAMFAVVVDGGRIQSEHQQLQNGADAAAVALGRTCARGSCDLDPSGSGTAGGLANANSTSGSSGVRRICGRGANLAGCPSVPENNASCAGAPPAAGSYVQVNTRTRLPDGTTLLPPVVAGGVFGNYSGTSVGACARAAWGAPSIIHNAFPILISKCAWEKGTANGTQYAPAPSATWNPDSSMERTISFTSADCAKDPSSTEGNFAVLFAGGGFSCRQPVPSGKEITAVPPTNIINNLFTMLCQGLSFISWLIDLIDQSKAAGRPLLLYFPVYDKVTTTGVGFWPLKQYRYNIIGYAAFELTGGKYSFLNLGSWYTGTPCSGDQLFNPCLRGFFTRDGLSGHIGTGNDFGVTAVELVG